ncbi:SulP family inorganic anion transporter [Shewanella sp. JM162201]|uniref:SulP family inorganic anion transporter n=1 Tax=Shewanella jiangmenensis TaxID=2837387 RepID=A0ABS5V2B1_9GAMM|nr:SulP family inorganic anion transporter [Shewanella jiangmenensis]
MPIFNAFDSKSRTSDIMGGVTAAIVSLPLALAFGVASGAGAQAGIFGALLVGLFAALFGGTRTLISEPTGPMTVVTTAVIASFTAAHPDKGLAMAFTVVMMAGLVQIILGALKFGRYITLMPYSVISGFMSGIGVLLIILQLPNLVGVAGITGGAVGVIEALPQLVSNIKWQELALALSALALMQIVPKLIKMRLPPQLLALVFCTLASVLLLDIDDVRRIGEINIGLPSLVIPTFTYGELTHMLISAVMLGALGCIDSLITAVIADRLTRVEHDSNKELIGQGLGNIASGLCGGLPGAGSTMGTVVNIQAGASSAFSGVVRVLTLLTVFSLAAGIVEYIPMAVLAAIAFKVGLNILDWAFVKRAHQLSRSAAMTMYVVMVLTVFVDLIVAVGVGMFIANLITIDRLSQLQERNINAINDSGEASDMRPNEKRLLDAINEKSNTLLLSLSGPMIFGVAKTLQRESIAVKSAETLVLDLCRVPYMDSTTGLAIENVLLDAKDCGCNVYLVVPRKYKWEANFVDHHSDLPTFHSRADALTNLASSLGIEVDELSAKASGTGQGRVETKPTSASA